MITIKPHIPDNILRVPKITIDNVKEIQQKENSALTICGGFLGNCYIMAEIINWLLYPKNKAYTTLKEQPWYRQQIKKHITQAIKELKKCINTSKQHGLCNQDFMEDVADGMYFEIKDDITRLHYSIVLYCKNQVKHPEAIAWLFLIDMLLQYIACEYTNVIEYMKTIYNPIKLPRFYDSWYSHIKNEAAARHWSLAIDEYNKKYPTADVDFNKSQTIITGLDVILNKMNDKKLSQKVKTLAEDINGKDNSSNIFNEAYQDLCPKQKVS